MDLKENYRKSTLAYFSLLLKKLFKSFDQSLFDHAQKASNNQEQNRYFEAMREFRAKSPELIERYQQFLTKGLDDFFADRSDTVNQFNLSPDELTLVDKDDLEDELAISIISSKANTRFAESLWKLNRRLAVIRGGKKVDDETNPCGPVHLCHALQHAAASLEIENSIKIQLYKMFDTMVMPRAGELYEKLNSHFTEHRILPNLQFQAIKSPKSEAVGSTVKEQPPDASSDDEYGEHAGNSEVQGFYIDPQEEARQQDLISAIRTLQHAGTHSGKRTTASGAHFGNIATNGTGGADSFNAADFAFALSILQQKVQLSGSPTNISTAKSVEYVENHFIEQLGKLGGGKNCNKITEEDADTIDLVGMLFKYVLDDPKLPDALKSLLSHLHTPMLKVALMDKAFFSQPNHPARRLLNLLAEIGGRWISDNNGDKLVFPKLRAVVVRVLKEFIDDLSLFDELLLELSQFARTLEKRAELTEKRNTEAEKGLERLAKARLRAAGEIGTRMDGKQVPTQARRLLEQPWVDFLAFNLLRHGDQSITWNAALRVVDDVILSVIPVAGKDTSSFHEMQQKLDQSISQGLLTIGYNQESSEQLLADLKEAQDLAIAQSSELSTKQETDDTELPQQDASQGSKQAEAVAAEDVLEEVAEEAAEEIAEEIAEESSEEISESKDEIVAGDADRIYEESDINESVQDEQKEQAENLSIPTRGTAISRQMQRQMQRQGEMSDELSAIHSKLAKLEFGTWFEFKREDSKSPVLLKLAWFSSISDHYMFVNGSGVKSAVKTQLELAQGIKSGAIKIADKKGRSFMERALENILNRLKLANA
jgi:hypothetical protein